MNNQNDLKLGIVVVSTLRWSLLISGSKSQRHRVAILHISELSLNPHWRTSVIIHTWPIVRCHQEQLCFLSGMDLHLHRVHMTTMYCRKLRN